MPQTLNFNRESRREWLKRMQHENPAAVRQFYRLANDKKMKKRKELKQENPELFKEQTRASAARWREKIRREDPARYREMNKRYYATSKQKRTAAKYKELKQYEETIATEKTNAKTSRLEQQLKGPERCKHFDSSCLVGTEQERIEEPDRDRRQRTAEDIVRPKRGRLKTYHEQTTTTSKGARKEMHLTDSKWAQSPPKRKQNHDEGSKNSLVGPSEAKRRKLGSGASQMGHSEVKGWGRTLQTWHEDLSKSSPSTPIQDRLKLMRSSSDDISQEVFSALSPSPF